MYITLLFLFNIAILFYYDITIHITGEDSVWSEFSLWLYDPCDETGIGANLISQIH